MKKTIAKNDPLRLLVVGGHPADTFNHCGGTLAHHVKRGDHVTAVTLTHGLRVHDKIVAEQLRLQKESPDPDKLQEIMEQQEKVKNQELLDALGILGINDVRFLRVDDSILLVTQKTIEAMARLIREIQPHVVITHYPLVHGGIACHHANTGKTVLYAITSAANIWPGDDNPGWRVSQIFYMSPEDASFHESCLAAESNAFCDYYVDITDVITLKVKAYAKLQSNQYGGNYARKSCETWNGKDGHFMRVAYAEGFIRHYPEIGDYLTVSQERLERANEPEDVMHARTDQIIASFVDLP